MLFSALNYDISWLNPRMRRVQCSQMLQYTPYITPLRIVLQLLASLYALLEHPFFGDASVVIKKTSTIGTD